jgi:hypothetical protein
MAIERKPLEQPEGPGYPDAREYATGRRAFLWLLGATALGVGGVYAWKAGRSSDPLAGSQGSLRGEPPAVEPPAKDSASVEPVVRPAGVPPRPEPAQPVVPSAGVPRRPESAQPVAPPPGTPPIPAGADAPPVRTPGKVRAPAPPEPAQPAARLLGEAAAPAPPDPKPAPARPQAQPPGDVAAPKAGVN